MARLGFYFNQEHCLGCRACQVACKDRFDLEIGVFFRRVRSFETGTYPNATLYHYSSACNHCETPACVANCPTGSMQKADDGTVIYDESLCIGCDTCITECPYGVPVILADKGVVGKCDSCKAFRDAGLNPVCVDACPVRALDFGDLDELQAKYGGDLVQDLPILPSSDTTHPSILIKAKKAALETQFEETPL